MRPTPGVDPPAPRSRKLSSADGQHPLSVPTGAGPMTFFLASDSDIGRAAVAKSSPPHSPVSSSPTKADKTTSQDTSYGVRSLEDARGEAFFEKAENDALGLERDTSEGDMLYRLLRMRRKRSTAATIKPPLVPSDSGNKADEDEDYSRDTREDATSTPRDAARSSSPLHHHPRRPSHTTISQPLTPLMVESPTPYDSACPSTPKSGSMRSLRLSEEDDVLIEDNASQAIVSSDEEDAGRGGETEQEQEQISSSLPELVMPSLALPSRRPFTARGRQIGRLKICVAGMRGIGKSSMIRAIVQHCEDIVHIDPVDGSPQPHLATHNRKTKSKTRRKETGTSKITEVSASTRAYPIWWTESGERRASQRRKSIEDTILERNLCIVDSPGYTADASGSEDHVAAYLESQFRCNTSLSSMGDNDLLNVLTGSGGVQVDLILFMFSPDGELPPQIDRFKRLASLTNVVPLLGKADALDPNALSETKKSIMVALQSSSAKPFLFGVSIQQALEAMPTTANPADRDEAETSATGISPSSDGDQTSSDSLKTQKPKTERPIMPPFAISTIPGSDEQEMDASLLMSSSYKPPLVSSDLQHLISLIFDPENIVWLRHNAVRKFIMWRNQRRVTEGLSGGGESMFMHGGALGTRQDMISRSGKLPATQSMVSRQPGGNGLSPFNLSSASNLAVGVSDITMTRIRDYTTREETLAQMQLSRWASELQRAMQQERNNFETLMDGERARWLLDRVNDEVQAGNIGALDTESIIRRLPHTSSAGTKRARKALSSRDTSSWAFATSNRSHRDAELPTWARPRSKRKDRLNPEDPLGLCEIGDSMRRTGSTVAKVVGGSVVVTAVYFAVLEAVHRFNGTQSQLHGVSWSPKLLDIRAWIARLFGFGEV